MKCIECNKSSVINCPHCGGAIVYDCDNDLCDNNPDCYKEEEEDKK